MTESARDALAYAAGALTPARKVGELLDAHRAEVLREAAAHVSECCAIRLRRLAEDPAAAPTGPDRCSGCRYVPCSNCLASLPSA